jgi:hypothetical protein
LYTLIHKRACSPTKWFKYIKETQRKSSHLLNSNLRCVQVAHNYNSCLCNWPCVNHELVWKLCNFWFTSFSKLLAFTALLLELRSITVKYPCHQFLLPCILPTLIADICFHNVSSLQERNDKTLQYLISL